RHTRFSRDWSSDVCSSDLKRHLIKKQLEANGLGEANIDVPEPSLRAIIRGYTREGGVRNLERAIGAIFGKLVTRVRLGKGAAPQIGRASGRERAVARRAAG